MLRQFLADRLEQALAFIFPDRCVGCGGSGSLLCATCRATVQPCPIEAPPPGLDAMVVGWRYEGAIRQAIHALKYQRRRRVARVLAEALCADLRHVHLAGDVLMPVPLHAERLAQRGFNQSEELARHLGRRWHLPVRTGDLVRQRDTGHQARLGRCERLTNVAGAFVWRATTPPPERVVLVDDVITTGATLGACAEALRAAGSRRIYAVALARPYGAS